jgi:hypothetical protein
VWLGFADVDVAPSPKFQERVPIDPPLSVEVSVNVAVKPFVVAVKLAAGVPPGLVTLIDFVVLLVLPLALSVTVRATEYVPAAA